MHDDPAVGKIVEADWGIGLDVSGLYTPELTASGTDPTLGDQAVQAGVWHRNGHLVAGWAFIQFGASGVNAGSGAYVVSLPFAADLAVMIGSTATFGLAAPLGVGTVRHLSNVTADSRKVVTLLRTASAVHMGVGDGTNIQVTDAAPFVWGAGDAIFVGFAYLADPAGLP